jgi:hypothetical protein
MKLKVFNAANSKSFVQGKSLLRINKRGGLLTFSGAATTVMGVKHGDKIVVVQDEESPENFYVHKTASPDGFVLRGKLGSKNGVAFNCSKLANMLAPKHLGISYPIGAAVEIDGMTYHLIVTAKPMNEKIDPLPKK